MTTEKSAGGVAGSQTLMRGLDVIEAVSRGNTLLPSLAEALGLTRSTTHRLAASLVERGYLAFTPRSGYRLGAKLLQLGHLAHEQADLIQVARPFLESLSEISEDTVHLGVLDDNQALYLDKIPGRRRINISSRVGDRQPVTSTGLGKALLLDHPQDYWQDRLSNEQGDRAASGWMDRMTSYAQAGRAYDLEENEDRIRCVAAPIRDAKGTIVGAISVSSAAQYMDDARMEDLSGNVLDTAQAISGELGWSGRSGLAATGSRRKRSASS